MKNLALINFMHSDPLYNALSDKDIYRDDPTSILKGILDGRYSAGMVSLMGYFANSDNLKFLETATIHSNGKILSTLLISNGPDIRKGIDVAVSRHTETTVHYAGMISRYLKLGFRFHGTDYTEADDLLADRDYALIIGDEALKVFNSKRRILMDIGYEYNLLFHLPPVFAVTVAQKDMDASEIVQSLNDGIVNSVNYVESCISANADRLHISKNVMKNYYSLIKYEFGDTVRRSIGFVSSSPLKQIS